jgi:glycosyltransferase involved in cell wall biosynthesis
MATNSFNPGGAETHLLELSRGLCALGHTVFVVSAGGELVPALERAGARHVEAALNTHNPAKLIQAFFRLKKLIAEEKPEIVHAHARIPAFLCSLLNKKRGFRFVTTAHLDFRVTALNKKLTSWGDFSLAVSEDLKQYLIREFGIPESRILVTVNGIDTERFAPPLSAERCGFLHISRLDAGPADIARQLIEIAPSCPEIPITIVGGGGEYEALCQAAKSAPNVRLTGALSDVREELTRARAFVGVSRAALEAMSAGLPVILAGYQGYLGELDAADEEAVGRAVQTNFTCRGYPAASAEELRNAIRELYARSDEELAREGAANRTLIIERYDVKRMVSDALEAYSRVL